MNRIVMMLSRNITKLPGLFYKLNHYAKHTDAYPEQEKYDHIRYMFQLALEKGNVQLQVTGQDNIPEENGYIIYANHQGLFDVVALVANFPGPLACVFKQEVCGA